MLIIVEREYKKMSNTEMKELSLDESGEINGGFSVPVMEKYIQELPMLVKLAIGMYLVAAGLNGMYDLGYMLGEFIAHII